MKTKHRPAFERRGDIWLPRPNLATPMLLAREVGLEPLWWRTMLAQQFDLSCMPCCTPTGCCPEPPTTVSFALSAGAGCTSLDGCSGTMLSDSLVGCDQGWLQSTLDNPACLVGSLRLCCTDEDGYTASGFFGLGFESISWSLDIVDCDPLELTGTTTANIMGCTGDITLTITE